MKYLMQFFERTAMETLCEKCQKPSGLWRSNVVLEVPKQAKRIWHIGCFGEAEHQQAQEMLKGPDGGVLAVPRIYQPRDLTKDDMEYVVVGLPDPKPWYISGAITARSRAVQERNIACFYEMENILTSMGRSVINPCRLDEGTDGWSYEKFIIRDLLLIETVRPNMYFMTNWQQSRGARLEHELAISRNLRVEYEA